MNRETFIVQTLIGFLTYSGGFSEEYPDAEKFTSAEKARRALAKCPTTFSAGGAKIFQNYGLENEREIDL